MPFLRFLFGCVALGLVPFSVLTQQAEADTDGFGFQFDRGRKSCQIPFELAANLIIIPVHVNQSDTLRFVLDTGVSAIILTDKHLADSLQLKSYRTVRISGAGERGDISARLMVGNTLRIGPITGFQQNLLVIDDDLLGLSEYVGRKIHGIIGYDLFARFVVSINYWQKQLIIQEPSRYRYRPSKGTKIPITIEESKPYLSDVRVNSNGQWHTLKTIIDTGAGHSLALDLSQIEGLNLPATNVRTQLGRGLSGNINGYLGRVTEVQLGPYQLQNVLTSYPDVADSTDKLYSRTGRQGNIGSDLLRRFLVTFHYWDGYLVIKSQKHFLNEPFEHNMSGIDVVARGKDFDRFFVEKVLPNSPAAQAGLAIGDEILFINERNAKRLTLNNVYQIFQKKVGTIIKIIARKSDGSINESIFALKRLI
jgi:predicted aspartyl protease